MQCPQQCQESGHTQRAEPIRLVECRVYGKIEHGALLVPHPTVVARDHAKRVMLRRQIRVLHPVFSDSISPVRVPPLQLKTVAVFFRSNEAQRHEIKREIAHTRGQAQAACCGIRLVISDHLLDAHRRRKFVDSKMTGIDDLDALSCDEPQFAISGLRYARTICASRSRAEPDTVRRIPNRGCDSALRVGDPRVQFGPRDAYQTTGGVQPQRTDPRHLAVNKLPPPVRIEQMIADHKTYAATSGLSLPPRVRNLAFDFVALSLVAPEKNRYRFKLEGWDPDWRDAVTEYRVEYSNLPPKHYTFRVIASNNSGVWNEQGAVLDFSIDPAFYQTNWFRALCVAAFLALLWALHQLRLRQLARQFNMRLEERVGERTRIARDLHDTLLQSFHGVLLYFQTGINLLPEHPAEARTAEARKTLEKAMHQAKHAIVEGREAIQGLRSSVVETNDLALAMRALGEGLAPN